MIFTQIALITILAAGIGLLMDKLRQPTILAYLIAGLLVAYLGGVSHGEAFELLESLGSIGVVLLLFLVGMELSVPRVNAVGRAAVLVGLGQIVFTVGVGWLLAVVVGYGWLTGLFLSVALAFSSTIVIVKLLGEKKELQSLHGRVAVGFLLVQDIAAILILVVLSALGTGSLTMGLIGLLLVKGGAIVVIVWWLSTIVVPWMVDKLKMSAELLFLSSVAWGLGFAALMTWDVIGFTPEAGGFLAGMTLANSRQHYEIFSRLRPLRDFFIMLFFVVLSIELVSVPMDFSWWAVVGFSAFVLIGNPFIVILIMNYLGYRARTGFLVSLTVAQISEFSLIVIKLGEDLGQVSSGVLGLVTMVAVITMTGSTYMIMGSRALWTKMGPFLKRFERKGVRGDSTRDEKARKNHAVLLGCQRTGRSVLRQLQKMDIDVSVMDFDPEVVQILAEEGVDAVLGDMEDVDMFETIGLSEAKWIISTVQDYASTMTLLEFVKNHNSKRGKLVVVCANYPEEAATFYEMGADYVNIPKGLSGVHVSRLLDRVIKHKDRDWLRERGEKELGQLGERMGLVL